MEIEDLEIIDFFKSTLPLSQAKSQQLQQLITYTQIGYRRKGHILTLKPNFIYLIRKGAISITNDNEKLFSLIGEHQWFGYNAQLGIYLHACEEDTLYYRIDKNFFNKLFANNPAIESYFQDAKLESNLKAQKIIKQNSLLDNSVLSMSRANDAVMVDQSTSIEKVAKIMTDKNVTSVVVTQDDSLCGIVTDRAFCTKVAALGLDTKSSIDQVMTKNPITIEHYKSGIEAMLLMANSYVRHLPIIKNSRVVGIVTAADLLRKQSHNVVF